MRLSNERLTKGTSSAPGTLASSSRIGTAPETVIRTRRWQKSISRHVDRQAETSEMVQRLVDAKQRPEPGMLVHQRHTESGSHDSLDTVNGDVDGKVDEGDEPESRRNDQDQHERNREVDEAMCQ